MNKPPIFCSICAHDIHSPACPHPWDKPFESWPHHFLTKLRGMLQPGPSVGS